MATKWLAWDGWYVCKNALEYGHLLFVLKFFIDYFKFAKTVVDYRIAYSFF